MNPMPTQKKGQNLKATEIGQQNFRLQVQMYKHIYDYALDVFYHPRRNMALNPLPSDISNLQGFHFQPTSMLYVTQQQKACSTQVTHLSIIK